MGGRIFKSARLAAEAPFTNAPVATRLEDKEGAVIDAVATLCNAGPSENQEFRYVAARNPIDRDRSAWSTRPCATAHPMEPQHVRKRNGPFLSHVGFHHLRAFGNWPALYDARRWKEPFGMVRLDGPLEQGALPDRSSLTRPRSKVMGDSLDDASFNKLRVKMVKAVLDVALFESMCLLGARSQFGPE